MSFFRKTAILAGIGFILPISALAFTNTYNFSGNTLDDIPYNTTLVRGGSVSVVDDTTLGRSIQLKAPATYTDLSLDAVSLSSGNIDVNFKVKGGTVTSTDRPGVLVFSNTDATTGYFVQWDNITNDKVKIFKRSEIGTPYTNTLLATSATYPTTTGKLWRVTATQNGTTATITAYKWNGSAWVQFLQYVDSTSPYLSGGVAISQILTSSPLVIDNIITTFPDIDTIKISAPSAYQIYQRNGSNVSDMSIYGSYSGAPTAIEASWNGGAYQTIDSTLSLGIFSGTLTSQPTGQGTLTVRFTNNTNVNTSLDNVGVGDVFVVAGQSNAVGQAENPQTYSHPTLKAGVFREDYKWIEGIDPTDLGTDKGSAWPLLATYVMADQNVPVAFITTAHGGTGLVNPADWKKGGTGGGDYEAMQKTVIRSRVNSTKAMLWFQGESDAGKGVSRTSYYNALQTLANNFATDIPGAPKTIIAQLTYNSSTNMTDDKLNAIRLAQEDAWNTGGNMLYGPATYDLGPHADGVHIATQSGIEKLGERWWRAVQKHFYGGADGRGPILGSAVYTGATNELILTFSDESLPLNPAIDKETFLLKDNGVPQTISSVSLVAENQVLIVPAGTLIGPATISIGFGNAPAGYNAVRDATGLIAGVIIDSAVTIQ